MIRLSKTVLHLHGVPLWQWRILESPAGLEAIRALRCHEEGTVTARSYLSSAVSALNDSVGDEDALADLISCSMPHNAHAGAAIVEQHSKGAVSLVPVDPRVKAKRVLRQLLEERQEQIFESQSPGGLSDSESQFMASLCGRSDDDSTTREHTSGTFLRRRNMIYVKGCVGSGRGVMNAFNASWFVSLISQRDTVETTGDTPFFTQPQSVVAIALGDIESRSPDSVERECIDRLMSRLHVLEAMRQGDTQLIGDRYVQKKRTPSSKTTSFLNDPCDSFQEAVSRAVSFFDSSSSRSSKKSTMRKRRRSLGDENIFVSFRSVRSADPRIAEEMLRILDTALPLSAVVCHSSHRVAHLVESLCQPPARAQAECSTTTAWNVYVQHLDRIFPVPSHAIASSVPAVLRPFVSPSLRRFLPAHLPTGHLRKALQATEGHPASVRTLFRHLCQLMPNPESVWATDASASGLKLKNPRMARSDLLRALGEIQSLPVTPSFTYRRGGHPLQLAVATFLPHVSGIASGRVNEFAGVAVPPVELKDDDAPPYISCLDAGDILCRTTKAHIASLKTTHPSLALAGTLKSACEILLDDINSPSSRYRKGRKKFVRRSGKNLEALFAHGLVLHFNTVMTGSESNATAQLKTFTLNDLLCLNDGGQRGDAASLGGGVDGERESERNVFSIPLMRSAPRLHGAGKCRGAKLVSSIDFFPSRFTYEGSQIRHARLEVWPPDRSIESIIGEDYAAAIILPRSDINLCADVVGVFRIDMNEDGPRLVSPPSQHQRKHKKYVVVFFQCKDWFKPVVGLRQKQPKHLLRSWRWSQHFSYADAVCHNPLAEAPTRLWNPFPSWLTAQGVVAAHVLVSGLPMPWSGSRSLLNAEMSIAARDRLFWHSTADIAAVGKTPGARDKIVLGDPDMRGPLRANEASIDLGMIASEWLPALGYPALLSRKVTALLDAV